MKQFLALVLTVCLVGQTTAGPSSSKPSGGSSWSSGSKPASSGGSKSSWSGGGSSSSSSSKPSPASSGGSKSSWGSGWTSSSSSPKPAPSSGSKSSWGSGGSSSGSTTKSPVPKYDKLAATDAKKAESRANYDKANSPAPTYKTRDGKEVKIDPKDKQIDVLRRDLDHQKWVNRQQRQDSFYNRYTTNINYTNIHYNDPFHPALNYWLLAQSIDTMAMFVYHHQASMDRARLNEMYAKNAQLQARVTALESQNVVRDSSWVPSGVDRDLIYDDGYVDAVYNPQPSTGLGFFGMLWLIVKFLLYAALTLLVLFVTVACVRYLLFEKRFNI